MGNSILVSSDHHANWDALEKLFQIASEKNIPFVINGDVVGDYNFEYLANKLGLKFPFQIEEEVISQEFDVGEYRTYEYIRKQNGNIDSLLSKVPAPKKEELRKQLLNIVDTFSSSAVQERISVLSQTIASLSLKHKYKLRALYGVIIKEHAEILARYIDHYKVPVYFLLGNHEPIYFVEFVKHYLENKNLIVDLGSVSDVLTLNGIRIAGISNVNAVMPFLSDIYTDEEINNLFSHQRGNRKLLRGNVTSDVIGRMEPLLDDSDWIRIMGDSVYSEIDVFFTHGQVGRGAWRDTKFANEVPTLAVAAMLSHNAHLTIDGHLHTSHEMENSLGKPTIRAVGNKGYIISKDSSGTITYELVSVDASYDARGGLQFEDVDFENRILQEVKDHFSVAFP